MAAPSHKRQAARRGNREENIPLASMMDIFTNMLLFLIMSYSATGLLVNQVDNLELPLSNIDTSPRETVGVVIDSGQLSGVPGVYVESKGKREREEQLGIPFDGQITIQADAAVNYNSILKVLNTCGTEGFSMTQFVVIKSE